MKKCKPKVWGMALPGRKYTQVRAVVATHSQKQAAAAFGVSLYEFRLFACETGNTAEVRAALAKPGQVFSRGLDDRGPFWVGLI